MVVASFRGLRAAMTSSPFVTSASLSVHRSFSDLLRGEECGGDGRLLLQKPAHHLKGTDPSCTAVHLQFVLGDVKQPLALFKLLCSDGAAMEKSADASHSP